MDTALVAIVVAAAAALATLGANWLLEGRKRLLELRARAYEDFLTAAALPDTTPEEVRIKSGKLLGAKARGALFGSGAVVDAMKTIRGGGSDPEGFANLLAAMREDLVIGAEDRRDGRTLLRAVFGPQDALRQLPQDAPKQEDA